MPRLGHQSWSQSAELSSNPRTNGGCCSVVVLRKLWKMEAVASFHPPPMANLSEPYCNERKGRLRCMCTVPWYVTRIPHGRIQDTNMFHVHRYNYVEQHKYHMILEVCFLTTHDKTIPSFKKEIWSTRFGCQAMRMSLTRTSLELKKQRLGSKPVKDKL
jgi:hypothetical protein